MVNNIHVKILYTLNYFLLCNLNVGCNETLPSSTRKMMMMHDFNMFVCTHSLNVKQISFQPHFTSHIMWSQICDEFTNIVLDKNQHLWDLHTVTQDTLATTYYFIHLYSKTIFCDILHKQMSTFSFGIELSVCASTHNFGQSGTLYCLNQELQEYALRKYF